MIVNCYNDRIDVLFKELEEHNPDHFAVRQYLKYKLAASKTAKSILISCGARLAPFDIKELRDLTEYDEMELDTLGDRKTAMFVIISDTDLLLSSIFTTAVQWQVIFSNPCMRVKPPKVHHKEERYLDEKEAAELIRQLVQGLRL